MTDQMHDEQETAWDAAMAEHEATLVVGARVRIRLSNECASTWHNGRDGQVGTIVMIFPSVPDGHCFMVDCDYREAPFLAACELLVLRAADPGEGED